MMKTLADGVMKYFSISNETVKKAAFDAAKAVEIQKEIIRAMREGDPSLAFSLSILAVLEQRAFVTETNAILFSTAPDTNVGALK